MFNMISLPRTVAVYTLRNEPTETIEALQEKLLDLNEQSQSIQAQADADNRDLSPEETAAAVVQIEKSGLRGAARMGLARQLGLA